MTCLEIVIADVIKTTLHWNSVGPYSSMTGVLRRCCEDVKEKHHGKMEAETGAMQPQARGHQD